ncbi:MAG: hypothetical protein Q8R90_11090 [Bacteroidales bacterium]|jgi:hypothetical protein|nr:hypothetical protein [Bacteroidales bacterium]
MDSTIISILIAIAILAFQFFNEKKKKERAMRGREGGVSPTGASADPVNSGISSLFADMLRDREEDIYDESEFDLDDESPYASLPSAEIKVQDEGVKTEESYLNSDSVSRKSGRIITNLESRNLKIEGGVDRVVDTEPRDIYDSPDIADHDYNQESAKNEGIFKGGFDPALFVIYSEIAKPKFED